MRPLRILAAALGLLVAGGPARADDTPAKSKIVAVDLFKNGLAVVKREVVLPAAGTYVIDDVPRPVYGTYWIESSIPIETLVQVREVDVPASETTPGNLQDDLAGKKVIVYFKGEKRAPVIGTMMKFKPAKPEEAAAASRYVVVQTAKGRVYVDAGEVASVEAEDAGDKVKRRQPRLILTLPPGDKMREKKETRVAIRYMTHGLSWSASYKIDIGDSKTLALEQHAVIRNEMADLDGAEVRLISGYPSVQFAHVRSLLSPGTTWAGFFQELGTSTYRYTNPTDNFVVTQNTMNVVFNNDQGRAFNLALGATPTGEGVDLHYQSIGQRSLHDGDTLALTVGRGKSAYERIVEWVVPDTRNDYGTLEARSHPGEDDAAWDALRFKNPLSYPMTTGAALVVSGGEFNGQRTSFWVNAGEETVLRVGKALSVRTRSLENEKQVKDRELVWIGGRQYRKAAIEGELAVSNHRKEDIKLVIRRRFSGELAHADGSPKSSLLEEGAYSINRRNELVWTLPLKSGEEKTLKYSYSVLVPF